MKKFLCIFSTLVFVFAAFQVSKADSIEVSGIVSGTWNVDTVIVTADIQIREAESLAILPGVMVLFQGEYFFEVKGALNATGTENFPILFTCADTTGFHNDTMPDGGWKQIRIENIVSSVDSTIFRYCHFEYGKAVSNDTVYGYGGAILIRNADKATIENCHFQNNYAYFNGGAVYLENAGILVKGNHFENNHCGQTFAYYGYGGGICTDWGKPTIMQNTFIQNTSTGIAGGLCVRFSDCPVSHNIFISNYSALGGGFGILHIDTCRFVIHNNLFTQNGAEFFGAAISNNDCSPTYVNNTIAGNHCDGGGGGFYCKDSVVPVLFNNIIYGNTQFGGESNQVYLWDLLSQPHFYYNNIEGGKENFYGTGGSAFYGDYENNIDENPMFEAGLFSIEPESPCVNTGNPDTSNLMVPEKDLAENLRIAGGFIDMGAFENQIPVGVIGTTSEKTFFKVPSPNPASEVVKFTFGLASGSNVILSIRNISGNQTKIIFSGPLDRGKHTFDWCVGDSDVASGIYLATLETGGLLLQQKIVVNRHLH
jgi:parallel beta-helix repeat protein